MIKAIINFIGLFSERENFDPEIRRWAETEYKKDVDYAYYMLSNGKTPYERD